MNRKQFWYLLYLAVVALLLVFEIVAVVSIARLKLIPGALVCLLLVFFLLYTGVVYWFMFLRGFQKITKRNARRVAKKRRIIACVLTLVMVCGCVVITSATGKAYRALKAVQVTEVVEEDNAVKRAIYVRTHDTAQTLADAKDYRFGKLIHFDDENTQQAVDAIEAQVGGSIQTVGYSSVFDLANSLLSGELDAVILSSNYISVLEGDSRFSKFSSMSRILEEVEIEGTGEEMDSAGLLLNAEEDIAENGKLKPFVVYISGSDSRTNSMQNNRSDVNIMVVVHPENRQILLVNTPRDYYIPSTELEGAMEKLSHAGVFGVKSSIESLETLYDQDITYYLQVSFGGMEGLVDAIGGITVYSDEEFVLYEDVGTIYIGENYLDGVRALAYARTRKGVEGGDLGRGNHQMDIIKAVVAKATEGTTILKSYASILDTLKDAFKMNIPSSLISAMVKNQLDDMSGWTVLSYSTYGVGGYGEVYSVPGSTVYIIEPDSSAVAKATKLIDMVMAGEVLTQDQVNAM